MMKSFIVAVNILALTLPFLAAQVQYQEPAASEVQYQEQVECHKNEETLYEQKKVSHIPMLVVLSNNPLFQPNYYQHRRVVPIKSPHMPFPRYAVNNLPYPYFAKLIVLGPQVQISKWQALLNNLQPATGHQTYQQPSIIATPPEKNQDETTTLTINNIAAVEPKPVPTTEVAANTVVAANTEEAANTLVAANAEEAANTVVAANAEEAANTVVAANTEEAANTVVAANTVAIPQASSELVNIPEATTVPVTPTVA